jgi:hypothetical protein
VIPSTSSRRWRTVPRLARRELRLCRAVDALDRGVQRLSVVAARDEDQVDVLVRVDRGIDQT